MDDLTAADYVGITLGAITLGWGLVLLVSHRSTKINLSIALTVLCLGFAQLVGFPMVDQVDSDDPGWTVRLLGGLSTAGFLAGSSMYMKGLLETASASTARTPAIRTTIRIAYVLAGLAGVLMALFPAQILNDLLFAAAEPGFFDSRVTWTLGSAFVVVGVVYAAGWLAVAREPLDVGERTRAICAMVMSLILTAAVVLPMSAALVSAGLVVLIGIYGQFRYFVEQGERDAFLSRFLSAHVAESVRVDGLASVMRPGEREVTVVACDLRGFTPYAEGVPSQAVIDLLGEYYDAVGVAVAEVSGTVEGYAGDGVLIVVGAPLPREDHAAAGLILARRLHEVVTPVREHWATGPHPLGLGVGVATGRVTAGAVGSSSRMEYTTVGTPVNLASRLCSAAAAGETLVDQDTAEQVDEAGLESRGSMPIKGLSTDQAVFALQ